MVSCGAIMFILAILFAAHVWFSPLQAVEAEPPQAPPGSPEAGRALLEAHCASCHAVGPVGDSPHPDAVAFRDLHLIYPVEHLQEALGEGIMVGHPDMPEFVLSRDQVTDVLAWLKSLETPETPAG